MTDRALLYISLSSFQSGHFHLQSIDLAFYLPGDIRSVCLIEIFHLLVFLLYPRPDLIDLDFVLGWSAMPVLYSISASVRDVRLIKVVIFARSAAVYAYDLSYSAADLAYAIAYSSALRTYACHYAYTALLMSVRSP